MSKLSPASASGAHGGTADRSRAALPERYRLADRHAPAEGHRLATDTATGEPVFVKRTPDAAREAEVLALLDHPSVVHLKHASPGADLLILEFVDGIDLEAYLGRGGARIEPDRLRGLLLGLADAAQAIHAAGFLHRDLKPKNVLVRPDGSPVILDLGAALPLGRRRGDPAISELTEGYAAPEQYASDPPEGPWTDVYGLGAIAWRALTGRPPPPAPERLEGRAMPPAAEAAPGYPKDLCDAVDRALALDPAKRPRSMAAWAALLTPVPAPGGPPASHDGDAELDDEPPTIRVRRRPRPQSLAGAPVDPPEPEARARRRWWLVLAVALLGALIVGAALALVYGRPFYERHYKTEWLVDAAGGGDATSIGGAIARAGDGATIMIREGTYPESLVLDRPLHLVAAAGDRAPLIAPEDGPCAVLGGEGASILGLRFQPPAAGQPGTARSACLVVRGRGERLESNYVSGAAGPAILVQDGADPVIRGNVIEDGTGGGIEVAGGATGEITRNTLTNLKQASLMVRGGAAPHFADNVIEASGGAVFVEGAGGTFERNRIHASLASALRVASGAGPEVRGNTIEQPAEAGIYVYDHGRGHFTDNTITGAKLSGVVVADGGNPRLGGNTIEGSGEHGILVVGQSAAILERNTIESSARHGIAIDRDAKVELTGNRLEGNREPQLLDARGK